MIAVSVPAQRHVARRCAWARLTRILHQFAEFWVSNACAGWVQVRRALPVARFKDMGTSSALRAVQKPTKRHHHKVCRRSIWYHTTIPVQKSLSERNGAIFGLARIMACRDEFWCLAPRETYLCFLTAYLRLAQRKAVAPTRRMRRSPQGVPVPALTVSATERLRAGSAQAPEPP